VTRDLRLLVVGSALSFSGDAVALVALTLRLQPHGSRWVGALLAAELLPAAVLAPVTGRLVDRLETRQLLVVLMSMQALIAVPLAFARDPLLVVMLFVLLGTAAAFVGPASSALVPAVTGPDEAARGFRLVSSAVALGYVVGPGLGGLLVSWIGSTWTVLIDAASFALLALSRLALTARRHPVPQERGSSRGPNPVWRNRALRVAVASATVALMCAVVDNVAAPFRFVDELDGSARTFGFSVTIWSIGALLGAPLSGKIAGPARALAAGNLVAGLGIAGIGLAPTTAIAYLAAVLGGMGNGMLNASQGAVVATQVPEGQHGRAFATVSGVFSSGLLAGTLIGPVLIGALGAGGAMTLAGFLCAGAALPLVLLGNASTSVARVHA
jgi:MFS family permease